MSEFLETTKQFLEENVELTAYIRNKRRDK